MANEHYAGSAPGRRGSFLPGDLDGPPSGGMLAPVWSVPRALIAEKSVSGDVSKALKGLAGMKGATVHEPDPLGPDLVHMTWDGGLGAAAAVAEIVSGSPKLEGKLSVDAIFVPAMMPAIGPASDPEPVDPLHLPPLFDADENLADIAVVDTGLYRPSGRLAGRARTPKNEREDPIGKGSNIAYSGACHGGAVAGLALDRTGRTVDVYCGLAKGQTWMCDSAIYRALLRAKDGLGKHGAINCSFGSYATDVHFPIATNHFVKNNKDILFAAAAGNDMTDDPWYPAGLAVDHDHVVSVGALDTTGPGPATLATFSNFGPWVRVFAPGVDVVTDYVAGKYFSYSDGTRSLFWGAARWSGTSFATPTALATIVEMWGGTGDLVDWWQAWVGNEPGPLRLA